MSLKKQCEEVLKNVDHSSYASVNGAKEKILQLMAQQGSDPYIGTAISKVEELFNEANELKKNIKEDLKPPEDDKKDEIQEENIDKKENETEPEQLNKQNQSNQQNTSNQPSQSKQPEQADQKSRCCLLI